MSSLFFKNQIVDAISNGTLAELEEKLKAIGLSLYNEDGSIRDWADIFEEIANVWDNIE